MSEAMRVYQATYGESHEAGLEAVFNAGKAAAPAVVANDEEMTLLRETLAARDEALAAKQKELDAANVVAQDALDTNAANVKLVKALDKAMAAKQKELDAMKEAAPAEKITFTSSDVGDLTNVIGTGGANAGA